jgi:hypothetical protein
MTSSGFYDKAKSRNPNSMVNSISSAPSSTHQVQSAGGKRVNMKVGSTAVLHSNETEMYYPSATQPGTVLTGGGRVDIRVQNTAPIATSAELQLVITSNADNTLFCPTPFLLDHLEFYGNGGNDLIQLIYPDHIWSLTSLFDDEEWSNLAPQMNTTVNWGQGLRMMNAEVRTLYIPLLGSFIDQVQPFISGLNSDIVIRCYFVPYTTANENSSVTTAPSLTSLQLILHCTELIPSEYSMKMASYRSGSPLDFRFMLPVTQKWTGTFNSGTIYTQQITGVLGKLAFWFANMRTSSPTGRALRTYLPISAFEVKDLNNTNIMGGTVEDAIYNRTTRWMEYFNSRFANYNPIFFLTHTPNPKLVMKGKGILGYYPYDRDNIFVTTGPTTNAVNEVQTITLHTATLGTSGTPASSALVGTCFFRFKGYTTNIIAAASFTTAGIQAAFNALNQSINPMLNLGVGNFTIAVTGAAGSTSALSLTITFANDYAGQPVANEGGLVELVSQLNDGTIWLTGTNVVTTAGVRAGTSPQSNNGWLNQSCDMNLWGFAYGTFTIKGGQISTQLV